MSDEENTTPAPRRRGLLIVGILVAVIAVVAVIGAVVVPRMLAEPTIEPNNVARVFATPVQGWQSTGEARPGSESPPGDGSADCGASILRGLHEAAFVVSVGPGGAQTEGGGVLASYPTTQAALDRYTTIRAELNKCQTGGAKADSDARPRWTSYHSTMFTNQRADYYFIAQYGNTLLYLSDAKAFDNAAWAKGYRERIDALRR